MSKDIDLEQMFQSRSSRNQEQSLLNSSADQPSHKRDQWNNDLEYFMSVLGYAVGYGSLWRFPYIMYKNGGGTFLIPYLFFVVIVAGPIFIFETGLGQIYQKSLPLILEQRLHKKWKGFGVWAVMVAFTQSTYYNYIQAFSIKYFLCSFQSPVPWSVGDAPQNGGYENAEAFLLNKMLRVSGSIDHYGHFNTDLALCYVVSMVVVYLTIAKGPTSSGRVALFTASAPYVLLLVMLFNGLTLEGGASGIAYLFKPDLARLKSPGIWVDAMVQVLFQYSCGMGVLVSFGSYRRRGQSLIKAAYGLIIGTFLCGILGGIIVFQYLGHMSHRLGTSINELPLQGPGLAFVAYPSALAMIPLPNLFSCLFFFMMMLLGIDTQMGLCECICSFIEDQFGKNLILTELFPSAKRVVPEWLQQRAIYVNKGMMMLLVACFSLLYCSGAGLYLLEHVDSFNATIGITASLLAELYLTIHHSNFYPDFKLDILANTQQEIPRFVDSALRYAIMPLLSIFLVCGLVSLVKFSFTVSVPVFLLLWGLQAIPILVAVKMFRDNKDVIQIYTQGENEMVDVKYYKPKSNIIKGTLL